MSEVYGDDENDFGMFEGEAVNELRQAKVKVTPEGVAIVVVCAGCGNAPTITVSWPEVTCLKHRVSPERVLPGSMQPLAWFYGPELDKQGRQVEGPTWRPNLACHQCGQLYPLRVVPNEWEGWLRQGVARGFVNPAAEQQFSNRLRQQLAAAQAQWAAQTPPVGR